MADIEFITAEACPFAQRTHLTLIEKGIDFDRTEVDLGDKPDWFEALSPYGKVPVLRRGGDIVYESSIINEYIEQIHPEPAILPADPGTARKRAHLDRLRERRVHRLVLQAAARAGYRPSARARRRHRRPPRIHGGTRGSPSSVVAPTGWGPKCPLVDFDIYPHFERFAVLTHYRGVEVPAHCARLRRWLAAMAERPSVPGDAAFRRLSHQGVPRLRRRQRERRHRAATCAPLEPRGTRSCFYDPRQGNHGLARDPFKSLVVPRPIGWISTVSRDGVGKPRPLQLLQRGNPPNRLW